MPLPIEDHNVWALRGNAEQNAVVAATLDRSTYPYRRLLPGLRERVGKTAIPVEWADLSRFGQSEPNAPAVAAGEHDHDDHDHGDEGTWAHVHTEEAHGVAFRNIVLGLAYYSGKVVLHTGLLTNPRLAGEVFLSEAAHMVDFFELSDEQRRGVYNSLHSGTEHDYTGAAPIVDGTNLGHDHGWFDVGSYREWAGEAWMGLFVRAYSDLPVTIPFTHPPTNEAVQEVRNLLTPPPTPPAPEPEDDPTDDVWGVVPSTVFHSAASATGRHRRVYESKDVEWTNRADALAAGRRPCKVCRP